MTQTLVFGHKNPDTDTVASAMAASYLINHAHGEDSKAMAQGEPNAETQFALKHFGLEALPIATAADTDQVVLVDHNEAGQSIDNLADVTVVGVYDHHKIDFKSNAPLWFINKPLGSVSTILYYEFQAANVTIPAELAGMMASAIISDTLLLKSPTTTKQDQPALEALAKLAGIDDINAYGLELLKAGTDLSSRTAQDLIDGDAKSFEMGGHTVRIGQVNTVDVEDVFARRDEIEAAMNDEIANNGYDTFILVVTNILESDSDILVMGQNQDIVAKAFNIQLKDGRGALPGVVSRKKQVVPPLTEAF